MSGSIRRFFDTRILAPSRAADAAGAHHALQLATAALLVEMTRADREVAEEERHAVDAALRSLFELSAAETRELVALAEVEAREATSLYQFTSLIDKQFSPEQKRAVVEMLWRVAYADARKDRYEEHLVRKVADLLHVSHKDFIRLRHEVEEERGAD